MGDMLGLFKVDRIDDGCLELLGFGDRIFDVLGVDDRVALGVEEQLGNRGIAEDQAVVIVF